MTRDQFRSMPPKRHDRDLAKSEVVTHIATTSGCNLEQAARTFHYLRNRGHLRFQKAGRLWMGVDHTPEESEAQFRVRITAENAFLQRRVGQLEHLVGKLRASHNELVTRISRG